jgi:hypothetical protein
MFIFIYFPFPDTDRIHIKKWKFLHNRLNADYCAFANLLICVIPEAEMSFPEELFTL